VVVIIYMKAKLTTLVIVVAVTVTVSAKQAFAIGDTGGIKGIHFASIPGHVLTIVCEILGAAAHNLHCKSTSSGISLASNSILGHSYVTIQNND
jgi:hypothetical protein